MKNEICISQGGSWRDSDIGWQEEWFRRDERVNFSGFRLLFYLKSNSVTTTPILSFPNILPGLRAVFKPDDTERNIALATTPVTQAQWKHVVQRFPTCGLHTDPSGFHSNYENPVESVSRNDVDKYIGLVNKLLEEEGSEYRCCLPSYRIWIEFGRAGRDCWNPIKDTISKELANYKNYKGTTPVMSFPPNPWGLYDMAGNVWEFVTGDDEIPDFLNSNDVRALVKELREELTEMKNKVADMMDRLAKAGE